MTDFSTIAEITHSWDIEGFMREFYDAELLDEPKTSGPISLAYSTPIKREELLYYIWWRTCLRNGDFREANKPLVNFFFRELITMNEPDETIQRWLTTIENAYGGTVAGDTAYVTRVMLMLSRGVYPERLRAVCEDSDWLTLSYLLAGPSINLSEWEVGRIIRDKTPLPDGFVGFLNVVLERFASIVWKEKDMGIVEFLSNYRVERFLTVFKDSDVGNVTFIADQPVVSERAYGKLGEIIKYCLTKFSPSFRKYRPKVCNEIKEIVEKALVDKDIFNDRPSEWLPQRTICTYPDDGRLVFGYYQRGEHVLTYQPHPLIRAVPDGEVHRYRIGDWDTLFEEYIDEANVSACSYVQCCSGRPIFHDLDRSMLDYFVYWRSEVLKGNHMDTDQGYLSLFIVEILRRHSDKDSAMKVLLDLADVYPCQMALEACVCFALVNGLELPPIDVELGKQWCEVSAMHSLRAEPIRFISADRLNTAVGRIVPSDYLMVNHLELCATINHILDGFDRREVEATGRRLYQNIGSREKHMAVTVFSQLDVYGHSGRHFVTDQSPVDDPRILKILRASLYVAVRHVCVNDGSSFPRLFRDADPEIVRQAERFVEGFRS